MKQVKQLSGFTLIELMVSMAIGLFLVAGVITIMLDSKENFLLEQELSYIQENARFAIDELSYDIRMAGYTGCSQEGELSNTVDDPASSDWKFASTGIVGYEQGDADVPIEFAADVTSSTDVLIINRGEPNEAVTVSSHNTGSQQINLSSDGDFEDGEILVIASANCSHMAIFQKTEPTAADANYIRHQTSGASPGNCHSALSNSSGTNYAGYDCSATPAGGELGLSYPAGSTIMRFSSNAYFVKNSPNTGLPSLFRETLVAVGSSATSQSREFVSGVEDFQIIYGVDNDATADNTIDRYYSAANITDLVGDVGNGYVGWDRVLSARFTLILRSMRPVYAENTSVNLGDGDIFNDRYMRQKVSSTVKIRNRVAGA